MKIGPFHLFYHNLTTFKFGPFPDGCATISLKSVISYFWKRQMAQNLKLLPKSNRFCPENGSLSDFFANYRELLVHAS